jgi:hypothetical protein
MPVLDLNALTTLLQVIQDDNLLAPHVELAYLFAETRGNQRSVLGAGARLVSTGKAKLLGVTSAGPNRDFTGYDVWRRELIARGVPEEKIIGIEPHYVSWVVGDGSTTNTLTEAMGLVSRARDSSWQRVSVVAAPFHQLRAFMSVVTGLSHTPPPPELRDFPQMLPDFLYQPFLEVYNHSGDRLPLGKVVTHGQGSSRVTAPRGDMLQHELKKIANYWLKDNLIDPRIALHYVARRDIHRFTGGRLPAPELPQLY